MNKSSSIEDGWPAFVMQSELVPVENQAEQFETWSNCLKPGQILVIKFGQMALCVKLTSTSSPNGLRAG